MEFRPPRRWAGVVAGSMLATVILALALFLILRVLRELPSFVSFAAGSVAILLLVLALCFAFWTYCCLTLKYAIDRNYLTISWGPTRHYIPLPAIDGLLLGTALPKPKGISGVNWPWHHVGRSFLPDVGETLFFTTGSSSLLYVLTPSLTYAMSVDDSRLFARELELRKKMGTTDNPVLTASSSHILSMPIWSDKTVQALLLTGIFVNLFVFGYLYYILPSQPNLITLKLTPTGAQEAIGWKWQTLLPMAMALVVLSINVALGTALYVREKVAAYLSLGSGLLLQIIISAAIFRALLLI